MILQLSFACYTIEQFIESYRSRAVRCASNIAPSIVQDCLETEYGTAIYQTWQDLIANKNGLRDQCEGWIVKYIAYRILIPLKRDMREMNKLAIITESIDPDDRTSDFNIDDYSYHAYMQSDNLDYLPHSPQTKRADYRMDLDKAIAKVTEQCKDSPARLRHLKEILADEPDGSDCCKAVLDLLAEALGNYKPIDNARRTRKYKEKATAKPKYENDLPALKAKILTMSEAQLTELHALIAKSPTHQQDLIVFPHITLKTSYRKVTALTGIKSGAVWQSIRRISILAANVRGEEVCQLFGSFNTEAKLKQLQKSNDPMILVAITKVAQDLIAKSKRYKNPNCEQMLALPKQLALLCIMFTDISHSDMAKLTNMTAKQLATTRTQLIKRLKPHLNVN